MVQTKICKHCGKEYKTYQKNQRCCSVECSREYVIEKNLVDFTCPHCGKKIRLTPWIAKTKVFCSKICSDLARTKTKPQKSKPKKVKKAKKVKKIKKPKKVKKAKPIQIRRCEFCGKEYEVNHSTQKFCSNNCSMTKMHIDNKTKQ